MSKADEWRLNFDAKAADRWHPEGVDRGYSNRRPEVGDVIAWDRRAWEVTHVRVEDPRDDRERRLVESYRDQHRDGVMPYMISLRRLHGAKHPKENSARDVPLRAPAGMRSTAFQVYPNGRVPLCSCCSDPWPCLLADAQKAAEASGELMEVRLARMMPGLCYGCGEVITARQGKVTSPGDHADFPGRSGPTFHTRQKCAGARWSYERRAGIAAQSGATALWTGER